MTEKPQASADTPQEDRMCFVVMPVSDPDGYVEGHFQHVYKDIVQPACREAGFSPMRADEVKQSNLIHLDILQKLIEAPMAVCDLSGRNPNVLFELALRQAFDKPVALIQEVGTPQIFDISPLRYTEYRKERIYHEVLDDQKAIATAIAETFKSHGTGRSINSIVKLLSLSKPAVLPDIGLPEAKEDLQQIILAELGQMRDEIQLVQREVRLAARRSPSRTLFPDLDSIRDSYAEARALVATQDEGAMDRAMALLNECHRGLIWLTQAQDDPLSRPAVMDLESRIKRLEMELDDRRHGAILKKRP
jgi:hypothetical protein